MFVEINWTKHFIIIYSFLKACYREVNLPNLQLISIKACKYSIDDVGKRKYRSKNMHLVEARGFK